MLREAIRNQTSNPSNVSRNDVVTQIKKEMSEMETRICNKLNQPSYSRMASSIKSLVNQNNQSENKDKIEKQARTLIVRRPKDHKIRSSTDIRSAISAKYRNSCIKHTRPCVGGSLLIEFANAEEAENVMINWDKTLFGGNDGVSKQQPRHTAGLIKQVERLPEQEIIDEIEKDFTNQLWLFD